VGTSTQPIPVHFRAGRARASRRHAGRRAPALLRDLFDLPDLAAMDDGIANGTHQVPPGAPAAAGAVHRAARRLFAAPAAPLHRHRPEHFQNFVLFTNYQFYIDEFIRSATS
jgi:AMP nucleosidase